MKILKLTDIEKEFTDIVNAKINNGYHFHFYRGSQGEEFKVILTKDDKEFHMIYVMTNHCYQNGVSKDIIEIIEEVFRGNRSTFWLGKGEEVFRRTYYDINRYQEDEFYVETEEEYIEIRNIQKERRNVRWGLEDIAEYVPVKLTKNSVKVALKLVQKQKGFKSVSAKCIMDIKRNVASRQYEVTVNRGVETFYVYIYF